MTQTQIDARIEELEVLRVSTVIQFKAAQDPYTKSLIANCFIGIKEELSELKGEI